MQTHVFLNLFIDKKGAILNKKVVILFLSFFLSLGTFFS